MFCVLTVVRVYVLCSDSGTRKKCLRISELYGLFHLSASECTTVHYTLRFAEYPGGS